MSFNLNLFNVNNFKNNCGLKLEEKQAMLDDLSRGKVSFLALTEALNGVLASDDNEVRSSAVEVLSWVLRSLRHDFLNEKELEVISAFYCDRLKDHHSVVPKALIGILALVKGDRASSSTIKQLLQSIFQFVTCQSQLARDRLTIYRILEASVKYQFNSIEELGPDFMFGVIAAMDGETDPQNLLVLFRFLPSLLSRLQFQSLTTDVFEVFSTYFPVDFTTVKRGKITITRENLSEGLCRCLSATADLAEKSLPLIEEKLSSTLKTAKIDSCKLLQRCCERLSCSQLEPHLTALWKILQRDLLPPLDPDIQREGLLTLTALTGALSDERVLELFLDDVIVAIHTLVSKPLDSLFLPAMKILEALCPHPLGAKRAFLELQVLCQMTENEENLKILLPCFAPFIQYMKKEDVVLQAIWEKCLTVKSEELMVESLKIMQLMVHELGKDEGWRAVAISTALRAVKNSTTRMEGCKLLRLLAVPDSGEILAALRKMINDFEGNQLELDVILDVAASLLNVPDLMLHALSLYIHLGTKSNNPVSAINSLLNATKTSLLALGPTSKERKPKSDKKMRDKSVVVPINDVSDFQIFYEKAMELVKFWTDPANAPKNPVETLAIYEPLGVLLKEIISQQPGLEQNAIIFSESQARLGVDVNTNEFTILIEEGILSSLPPFYTVNPSEAMCASLSDHAVNCKDEMVRLSYGRLLATFANKTKCTCPENPLECFCKTLIDSLSQDLTNGDSEQISRKIKRFAWVLKGALLRGHSGLEPLLASWFTLLDDPKTAAYVPECTKIILQDEPVFLNESCHCNVKYLYKQRMFAFLPNLAHKLSSIESEICRRNFLLTALVLASSVPQQAVKNDLQNVAIVVSLGMKSSDQEVVEHSLNLLTTLLEERCQILIDNAKSLLMTLLELGRPPASLRVRKTALHCIFLAGFYPTPDIIPYKSEVIRGLTDCLDDHKRIVRAEAGSAASRWHLVGAVGEDSLFAD